MEEPRWTLDELAGRVDAALAVDYRGQPSGRVRAVPDRRAIRWYTTIGLIDRPVAHRGRTALYGPRHLLQLVAVKRLQAKGLPLVAIQQELAGATDTQLARVARLPAGAVPLAPLDGGGPPGTGRVGPRTAGATELAAAQPAAVVPRPAGGSARRASFWRQQPAFAAATVDAVGDTDLADPTGATDLLDPAAGHAGTAGVATLRGVRLGDGATLLLEPGRELEAADVHAIVDAAGPLLAALRDRGLGGATGNLGRGPRRAGGNEPRREHP
jgi:DNA-binding transcriptional MerR regulator